MGTFDAGKSKIFLNLIPILILFLQIPFTSGHEVGSIYYCIGCRTSKVNWIFIDLLFFPLFVANLPVISTCTIAVWQELHQLYCFLLRFMVAVVRYSKSEIIGFLVTHYGIFFNLLDNFPSEQFLLDLQFLFIWHFLPHLWNVANNLVD